MLLNKADLAALSGGEVRSRRRGAAAPSCPPSPACPWSRSVGCWPSPRWRPGARVLGGAAGPGAHPGGASCLGGSHAEFLAAPGPVPADRRLRLLDALDLFGIALGIAALRRGRTPAQVRALLRQLSGVDAVVRRVAAAGAAVRYRRVLDAVADLEALAVSAGGPNGSAPSCRGTTRCSRGWRPRWRWPRRQGWTRARGRPARRPGRGPDEGGALAPLRPWQAGPGERAAPSLRGGHRQGVVAALVAGPRVLGECW